MNAYEEGDTILFSSVCLGKDFTMDFEGKFSLFNASVAPGRVYSFEINLTLDSITWQQVLFSPFLLYLFVVFIFMLFRLTNHLVNFLPSI